MNGPPEHRSLTKKFPFELHLLGDMQVPFKVCMYLLAYCRSHQTGMDRRPCPLLGPSSTSSFRQRRQARSRHTRTLGKREPSFYVSFRASKNAFRGCRPDKVLVISYLRFNDQHKESGSRIEKANNMISSQYGKRH